ncbi:MAG TPA: ABC transporter permease [Acidimicrobiia bacterium]
MTVQRRWLRGGLIAVGTVAALVFVVPVVWRGYCSLGAWARLAALGLVVAGLFIGSRYASGLFRLIGGRLAQGLLLFITFLALVYLLLEAQPGDITQQLILNPKLPPEAQDIMAAQLGLDQPLPTRVVTYTTNFFCGELGFSFSQYPQQVAHLIAERLPRTITLFLSATVLAYFMGFGLGKVLAWRRGKRGETAVTLAGVGMYTVFYPWFAILMIWFFGYILNWFPIAKFTSVDTWSNPPDINGNILTPNYVFTRLLLSALITTVLIVMVISLAQRLPTERRTWPRRVGILIVLGLLVGYWATSVMAPYAADILHHTMLPVITLASVTFAGIMLLTRSSMLETLREDYILTARAKGLTDADVRDRHAARNALLPVVTSLVLALAFVISGGIITESVFSWPGLGSQLLGATLSEDIPLATGTLGIIAVLALIGHLVADVMYMYLDPRIRYS